MTNPPQTHRQYRTPPAAQLGDLSALGPIKEVPVPKLGANEVLVKVRAVSLNYRDLIILQGAYPFSIKPNGVVPTSDLAGEIVALGNEVASTPSYLPQWKIGDRVCSNFCKDWVDGEPSSWTPKSALGGLVDGGLQEYIALPAHGLVRFPDYLSYEQAATLPCAALAAYNALTSPSSGHPLKAGDWVLVQGTGGVSIWGLQLAKASGARVIATSSSDEKLEIAGRLGADVLINYNKVPEWGKEAWKITGGKGVDHVIEVGGPGTIEESFEAIRYGGTISTIGFVAGSPTAPTTPLTARCLSKAAILRGVQVGSVRQFEQLNRLLEANKVVPIVDKVFPFEEAAEAYQYLKSQKHVGKVVIKVAA